MVEEFEFYRNVRAYYCRVLFTLSFTYRFSHRHAKKALARGSFSCGVNVRSQTVEYVMKLKSDPIERPFSEHGSFLFASHYEGIPSQTIEFENYPIYKVRYRVPIDYDWQQFIVRGAENAINPGTIGQLFKKWKLKDTNGQPVDAGLKVEKIEFHW